MRRGRESEVWLVCLEYFNMVGDEEVLISQVAVSNSPTDLNCLDLPDIVSRIWGVWRMKIGDDRCLVSRPMAWCSSD